MILTSVFSSINPDYRGVTFLGDTDLSTELKAIKNTDQRNLNKFTS
jgi:hypothetical protein